MNNGRKESIMGATALWCDIDTVKQGWDTDATARALFELKGILQPSAIVKTGGGIHVYWFLNAPYLFKSEGGLNVGKHQEIEDANRVMQELVSGDNTQNVDRILRLPGSKNTKRGKPEKVDVMYCYAWARKDIHDLVDAALSLKKTLVNGQWLTAKEVQRIPPTRVDHVQAYENALTEGRARMADRVSRLWDDRVRYHAPRGYMGIDEAVLITTAKLHSAGQSDEFIVKYTMRRIRDICERDAPGETWDWEAERKNVEAKLLRWKPQWKEIKAQHDAAKKALKKQNGKVGEPRAVQPDKRNVPGRNQRAGRTAA
jgi:hypothetical protein